MVEATTHCPGLTQEDLAQAVSCSLSLIRKYKTNQRRPSRQIAARIAVALAIPAAQQQQFIDLALFGSTTDPTSFQIPAPPANDHLPAPPGPLIGRALDLAALRIRLPASRLLTLTGPPGVGKTRLAIEAARQYAHDTGQETRMVELAPLAEPQQVLFSVAQSVGVRSRSDEAIVDALALALQTRPLLLLLDNFEHVLDAGPALAQLLARCPDLRVLATSRVALRLRAERRYPVAPLVLPDGTDAQAIDTAPAVALFAERAKAVAHAFQLSAVTRADVRAICMRLDGLPLAIELAAARVDQFAPAALLAQLERRLPTLDGGPRDLPSRQQTLRDAIRWSYDLLKTREQAAFAALSVFVGSFDAEAAAALGVPNLDRLVRASLIQPRHIAKGQSRFVLLETLREFAHEQLSPEQHAALCNVHAQYFAERAGHEDVDLLGEARWLQRIDADVENYRAAINWSLAYESLSSGARIIVALRLYFSTRGLFEVSRPWALLLAERPDTFDLPPALHARVTYAVGFLCSQHIDTGGQALTLLQRASALAGEVGNTTTAVQALIALGMVSRYTGNGATVMATLNRARDLAEVGEEPNMLAQVYAQMGMCLLEWGRYGDAQLAIERVLSYAELAGRELRVVHSRLTWPRLCCVRVSLCKPLHAMLKPGNAL